MKYKYMANATTPNPTNKVITVKANTYDRLSAKIREETASMRYYTQGVNGGMSSGASEPYTKDLIYPKVKWSISREEHDN